VSRRRTVHGRDATDYVQLDSSCCEACWKCLEVCPNEVLGKVDVLFHRHAKLRAPEACTGCGRCAKVCESGALRRRADAPRRERVAMPPAGAAAQSG